MMIEKEYYIPYLQEKIREKKQRDRWFWTGKIVSRRKNPGFDFKLALPLVVSQIINVLYNIRWRNLCHRPYRRRSGGEALPEPPGLLIPISIIVSASAALFRKRGRSRVLRFCSGKEKKEERGPADDDEQFRPVGRRERIFLTLVTLAFDAELLRLFRAEAESMGYAEDYLGLLCPGNGFVMISIGAAFITAQGLSKIAMLSVSLGALLNIVLNPVFIYALGLGVKGAAPSAVRRAASAVFWPFFRITLARFSEIPLPQANRCRNHGAQCFPLHHKCDRKFGSNRF